MKMLNKKFLADQEGLSLTPYRCNRGVATIGIGTTVYPDGRKVSIDDKPITVEQAYDYLEDYLERVVYPDIQTHIKTELNQNQFDALCSFLYNLGHQALINRNGSRTGINMRINLDPNDLLIIDEFLKWDRKNLPVLARHAREANLYFSDAHKNLIKEKLAKFGKVDDKLYFV